MSTTYTYTEIKTEIAENIGYDDGANGILSDKDITESMIGKYVNRRYYELLTLIMAKYPEDYIRDSYADFWKVDGTVASNTTTTLVVNESIFNGGMVGDTIYNSTVEESATIVGFSSATTITLDSSTGWSASDVVYVFGTEFALGGDAVDSRYIQSVAVKYSDSDTYYKKCEWIGVGKVFQRGDETYDIYNPRVYKTNLKVSGAFVPAIGIVPEPTLPITRGIKLSYLEVPAKLSTGTDVPELPLGSQHILIAGGTIDALKKLRRYDEIPAYMQEYQMGKAELIANYARSRAQNQAGKRDQNYLMRVRLK